MIIARCFSDAIGSLLSLLKLFPMNGMAPKILSFHFSWFTSLLAFLFRQKAPDYYIIVLWSLSFLRVLSLSRVTKFKTVRKRQLSKFRMALYKLIKALRTLCLPISIRNYQLKKPTGLCWQMGTLQNYLPPKFSNLIIKILREERAVP